MPVNLSYPGVYVEELPGAARSIVGVATSRTAFLGRALRGPVNEPVQIHSFGDFARRFGGIWVEAPLGYALQHYFANGGSDAVIVRLINGGATSRYALAPETGVDPLLIDAASPGKWGNALEVFVDHDVRPAPEAKPDTVFNLRVEERDPLTGALLAAELHRNVSVDPASPRHISRVLAQESALIALPSPFPGSFPLVRPARTTSKAARTVDGSDGTALTHSQYDEASLAGSKQGIWALEKTDLFNLLSIPPYSRDTDVEDSTWSAALAYCKLRRAMLIVDAPSGWKSKDAAVSAARSFALARDENAVLFFPRIKAADPFFENRLESFAPGGAVAGVIARTDATRGIWKAPAGLEAQLNGVTDLEVPLTDSENGELNPLGVNCLRAFPTLGRVIWGARTWEGADSLASEWKYLPVRRLALYIEESLYRGTQWVVFEPNDTPLWAQIRLNIGAFMQGLFRQGAFQGSRPQDAYLVKCDSETTTQADIAAGVCNIIVGFAPLKPAEFVIIKLQQLAGQTAA
ncbi:phage tail sheath family protein [Niveibacterium terrae]|uniref:phage tail sheath family protein n=1 Tax=Niveibacterium terrae TaxID=3373598 RepID=UPI003A8E10F0